MIIFESIDRRLLNTDAEIIICKINFINFFVEFMVL